MLSDSRCCNSFVFNISHQSVTFDCVIGLLVAVRDTATWRSGLQTTITGYCPDMISAVRWLISTQFLQLARHLDYHELGQLPLSNGENVSIGKSARGPMAILQREHRRV